MTDRGSVGRLGRSGTMFLAAMLVLAASPARAADGRPAGAPVVVNAPDGPTPATRAALQGARDSGAAAIVLKLENLGLIQDEELIQLIAEELSAIAAEYGYGADAVTLVKCPAACE